jgi:transposase
MKTHAIQERFELLKPFLDEKRRRLLAAAEAKALGRGGTSIVSRATGISRVTIIAGRKELQSAPPDSTLELRRTRKPGGGRKKTVEKDPRLINDLESLIEPYTRGQPDSPLRWTCKSVRRLADELKKMGHATSHRMVAALLQDLGYSLQSNRKSLEGSFHPDRNSQFEHINSQTMRFQAEGQPVISVDTKKKELVGDFKNNGRELRPKGDPERVRVHDFKIKELGKVAPYGVFDLKRNEGWVSVGTDHDTAAFAVESIRRWWKTMGCSAYPAAKRLLITADSGGSNGARVKLWKTELQELVNQTGLEISVSHFPPGTSKWNKIEHRLFSHISQNWRGKPLISHEVIVNLIGATTTKTGLKVKCALDRNLYPKGIKISSKKLAQVQIERSLFHGEWNYTIKPERQPHL